MVHYSEDIKAKSQPEGSIYIVTGADGFIGRAICARLASEGARIRILVQSGAKQVPPPECAEVFFGDVLSPATLEPLLTGIDAKCAVFIHAAGVVSVKRRDKRCYDVNFHGTRNVLELCSRHGVGRFVYISSVDAIKPVSGCKLYEPERFCPEELSTDYGRSKAAAANLVLDEGKRGMAVSVLLPTCVLGPEDHRMGFASRMIRLYLGGLPRLSVKGGYEFADVRDVAAAAVTAARLDRGVGPCIISGSYMSMTGVFDCLAAHTGRRPTLYTLPLWAMYPVLPVLSLICRLERMPLLLSASALRLLRIHPSYSHEKAEGLLGFIPRDIHDSIRDTAEFIMAHRAV